MAYSNNLSEINAGLMNYIGAAINAVPAEGRAKNQLIEGLLMDAVMATSQMEKGTPCDPYILVPMFKGNIIFLKQQQYLLSKDPTTENKNRMIKYQAIIEVFEQLIKENTPKTIAEAKEKES